MDEKKIEKDTDLDQVNCGYTALRFLGFGSLEEKMNREGKRE